MWKQHSSFFVVFLKKLEFKLILNVYYFELFVLNSDIFVKFSLVYPLYTFSLAGNTNVKVQMKNKQLSIHFFLHRPVISICRKKIYGLNPLQINIKVPIAAPTQKILIETIDQEIFHNCKILKQFNSEKKFSQKNSLVFHAWVLESMHQFTALYLRWKKAGTGSVPSPFLLCTS